MRFHSLEAVSGFLSICALGACGSEALLSAEHDDRMEEADATRAEDRSLDDVVWGACPDGFSSECTTIKVPIDWQRPWRRTIDVFVARYPAAAQDRSKVGQLWILTGGPGDSLEYWRDYYTDLAPWHESFDIMMYEHRGVGESTRLACPATEDPASEGGALLTVAEAPACIATLQAQWGEDLGAFNTTNAARDLDYVIKKTRQNRKQTVFLYGVSYGTLLLQRFLQLGTAGISGAILDGVVAPDRWSFFNMPSQVDPVARDLARVCDEDAVCGTKLGGQAWSFLRDTLADVDRGHCPALATSSYALGHYGAFLMRYVETRRLIFPFFYRIARCDGADVAAVRYAMALLDSIFAPPPGLGRHSEVLLYNIGLSELTERRPPSLSSIQSACERAALCDVDIIDFRRFRDVWPLYPLDRFAHRWAETSVPILAMNGDWDAATPIAQASRIERHLSAPSQNYVQFSYGAHFLVDETEVRTPGQLRCSLQVMKSFTDQPTRSPNTSCLGDLLLPTFVETPEGSQFFFGVDDLWENATPARSAPSLSRSVRSGADAPAPRRRASWPLHR
jgi:pimeloyl-ACP methyl ester carboxylesterase